MQQPSLIPEHGSVDASATISDDGLYRYDLIRRWGVGRAGRVLWIMLNPSTADAMVLDPTLRRCVGFSKAWGFDGMTVCNLYAYRSTDPKKLRVVDDPVGPDNDMLTLDHAFRAPLVICGWGDQNKVLKGFDQRAGWMLLNLRRMGCNVAHLGFTAGGYPRHPLYLPADLKPLEYR
jgi:hypothetical protein